MTVKELRQLEIFGNPFLRVPDKYCMPKNESS